jgi:hypothetical protein
LDNVPTSVDMHEYTDHDLVNNRWVDTWEPVLHPENTKSQSIRCYTPADLEMLFWGLSLEPVGIFFDGKRMDSNSEMNEETSYELAFVDNYSYRTVYRKK